MKGDVSVKILEVIGDFAGTATDFFDVVLSASYGASYGKLQYEISKRQNQRIGKSMERNLKRQAKQRYYNMVYYLKKDGLIGEEQKNNKRFFILTKKGKEKLAYLKEQNKRRLPEAVYLKEGNNKFVIVVFDIPELEKRKREWLRAVLVNLGFKMIQKSVWMGKVKIPKEFLGDLFKMKLVDFVEIFEISKTGSLEHLI
ncbi:MAG: CRISPR-associated endonuclease Cas2 [bacterium]|nr:CRISPR-associated endonuclease Cas2 [bacterium]